MRKIKASIHSFQLNGFVRFAQMIDCRGQPGGWYLSFACPKERYQRKRHPAAPPFGFLRLVRQIGRLRNSP
jgi:hypothetical protein